MISLYARARGFSMIELMVVVVIVAILAMVAIPAYSDFVRRSYRTDATNALLRIWNAQEKYYLNHNTYADTMAKLNISGTENNYYLLTMINGDATGFVAEAYVNGAGPQKDDIDNCYSFRINQEGVRSAADYGNADGVDNTEECWE